MKRHAKEPLVIDRSKRKGAVMPRTILTIKGIFQDGVARPSEPIEGREGQQVIITFLDEEPARPAPSPGEKEKGDAGWNGLMQLIEDCAVDTGIDDLAHQHDHYLYGTPKKD
jgi:hypothetical protein